VFLSQLQLANFRSYNSLDLSLDSGVTTFVGENGEGKTNIVESIIYLSILSSHRVSTDQPLVRLGSEQAIIRAKIKNDGREALLEIEINSNKANRAKVNNQPTRSQRAILGFLQTTFFSPEDLDLVRGDPSGRRSFIDQTLIQQTPRMSAVISDYERSLKQRNSLLKTRAPQASLEPWDNHLIEFGAEIIAERIKLLLKLESFFNEAHENISKKKSFTVDYRSNVEGLSIEEESNKVALKEKLIEIRAQEKERGLTLLGPHRDDLSLLLDNQPVKGYASQGESWSVALTLKLATYLLLRSEDKSPILILDDVFAELDEKRRSMLVDLALSAEQTLVTVAVQSDLPSDLAQNLRYIREGKVN